MKTVEERLKSYEPLWEKWRYSGEFLGEGAMSSVFEIESTEMGFREVAALKIVTVKKDFRGEVRIPENALNEIRILRDLAGCPNIVQYHDSTQRKIYDENGELSEIDVLIKMEKLQSLTESDRLTETQVIKLAKDICNALDHATQHGIIHRDIKPQNIFYDKDGTYKLGDFGIAKIVSGFAGAFTMNVGTLAYAAPEVRGIGDGKYDVASDIYSLGLVLYTFLNYGRMPFADSAGSLNEAITKRLSGAKFPSPALGSKNLKMIVMRACNADINKRYKTPKEMLDDIELLSTGGKRMIIDPFATLDANLDVIEAEIFGYGAGAPVKTPSVTPVSRSAPPVAARTPVKPAKEFSTSGGLKINMRKTDPPVAKAASSDSMPPKSAEPITPSRAVTVASMPPAMVTGGLKSSMRKVSVSDTPASVPEKAPIKKENDENASGKSFFSAPDSL